MRFDEIPYPIQERWAELGGAKVCYGMVDAPSNLRPLLLIPPLGRGLLHYRPNLDAFARLGPVILYDPPGCGKSQKDGAALELVGVDKQANVAAQIIGIAHDCRLVQSERVVVIGTSYGALIALGLAANHPELVSGLVLADAMSTRRGICGSLVAWFLSCAWLMRRFGRNNWRRGARRFFANPDHPAVEANVDLAMRLRTGPDWPAYLRILARATHAAMESWSDEIIATVRERSVPTLVIWGDTDRVTPIDWGRELAMRLAARLEVIPKAGHFPNMEQPRAFESAVSRFVDEISAKPTTSV